MRVIEAGDLEIHVSNGTLPQFRVFAHGKELRFVQSVKIHMKARKLPKVVLVFTPPEVKIREVESSSATSA